MKINYKERKLVSEEQKSQKDIEFAVENAKLQLSSDILATKQELATKEAALEDAKSDVPLNTECIINLMADVEALKDGVKKLEALKKEFNF